MRARGLALVALSLCCGGGAAALRPPTACAGGHFRAHARARRPVLSADRPSSRDLAGPPASVPPPADPRTALFVLFLVPLAWGTYGPSVKSLYALDAPPPELLFTWLNYIVSSSTLAAITSAMRLRPGADRAKSDDAAESADAEVGRAALLAGLELGGYLFLGSTVQIFGMRYTTAGRAAFIVQLTTVIVPLLDGAINRRVPSKPTLGACVLAFCGVALLVTAGADGVAASSTMLGDGLIGASALVYSLHVVRLAYHAPRLPPLLLARAKEVSRLGYASAVLAAGVYLAPAQAEGLRAFVESFSLAPAAAGVAAGIVLWNGLVTTAFPTWAQSFGQRRVSAGTASVVYATQPLWSALFGYLLLGETFGSQALAGAAVILAAVLLASREVAGESTNEAPEGGAGGGPSA